MPLGRIRHSNAGRHSSPKTRGKFGVALFRLGRDEDALKSLTEAITTDSSNCDAYFSLGSIYMKKDYEKAAAMFDKRISCDPKTISLAANLNAAASYMQLKNYPRVRELLVVTIEREAGLPAGPALAGQILYPGRFNGQCQGGIRFGAQTNRYERRQIQDRGEAGTTSWACTTSGSNSSGQSVESFRRASGLGKEDASLRLTQGQAVMQTLDPTGDVAENDKKIEECIRLFRRTIELEAGNVQGHSGLRKASSGPEKRGMTH